MGNEKLSHGLDESPVVGEQPVPWRGKDICERTFRFARSTVRLCRDLNAGGTVGRTLGRQLLRSGTSVGANVEEAQSAQSKADFISKMNIALKEARETRYWLRLVCAEEIIPTERTECAIREADEIAKILHAIVTKTRTRSEPQR